MQSNKNDNFLAFSKTTAEKKVVATNKNYLKKDAIEQK